MLFTIGGDGTQRGGHDLFQEAKRRGHALAVVGIFDVVKAAVTFTAGAAVQHPPSWYQIRDGPS
jgi:6-phosphofructokinase 1